MQQKGLNYHAGRHATHLFHEGSAFVSGTMMDAFTDRVVECIIIIIIQITSTAVQGNPPLSSS